MIFLENLIIIIDYILPLLISVAFYTISERKIMASMQRRRGPNVVGFLGLLQPIADGIKLLGKETIIPAKSNSLIFIFAPMLTFILSFISWAVIPFDISTQLSYINLNLLYIMAVSSVAVYGVLLGGWSSHSKYAVLGALRSTAQMVSYELTISFVFISICISVGSLNLLDIVLFQQEIWFLFPFLPLFIIFLVSILAETNRVPFDLPEAEAEIVAGYNIEYSSMTFALFFLGEYSSMMFMSALTVLLFLGGWLPFCFCSCLNLSPIFWFVIKVSILLFWFVWVRATLPRYRFDQLMNIGWKIFLPFTLGFFIFLVCFLYITESFIITAEILTEVNQSRIF